MPGIDEATRPRKSPSPAPNDANPDSRAPSCLEDSMEFRRAIEALTQEMLENRRLAAKFHLSEECFRRTFDEAPIGAAIVDPEGRIRRVNKEFCRMTGCSPSEMEGRMWWDIAHGKDLQSSIGVYLDLFAGRIEQGQIRGQISRKDGSIAWTSISLGMVRNPDGEPFCFLPMIVDVTERMEAEMELEEKNAQLHGRAQELEQMNATLHVLLQRRERDKREIIESVEGNIKLLISPYVQELKETGLNGRQRAILDMIEGSLRDIASPFARDLFSIFSDLTAMEVQVAHLVEEGKTSKEIGSLLDVAENTVRFHKYNLRGKLGIRGKKINLRSFLQSLGCKFST